jgi:putative FmdB family regulatory protein
MPTYDYKCEACGSAFERFQSITAAPIKKCPSCGKNKVRRLIGPGAGLIFKGSGFYITDYRSEGYKNAAKQGESGSTEAKSDTKSDATASKSGDSKSTTTTESKPRSESKPAARSDSKKK